MLHVKISSYCPTFVGDPQDDLSWPVRIGEKKLGKQPVESASDCCDTHYRESLSPFTGLFVLKFKWVCIVVLCKCVRPHKTTPVCLHCWFQRCDFPALYSNRHFACVQEYICPRCDSGFIEEVTEDSRWAFQWLHFLIRCLQWHVATPALLDYHGGSFSTFWSM